MICSNRAFTIFLVVSVLVRDSVMHMCELNSVSVIGVQGVLSKGHGLCLAWTI